MRITPTAEFMLEPVLDAGSSRDAIGLGQAAGPLLITAIAAVAPLGAAAVTIGAVGLVGAGWLWRWVSEPAIPGH